MHLISIGTDILNASRMETKLLRQWGKPQFDRFSSRILHPQRELPQFHDLYKTAGPRSSEFSEMVRLISNSWCCKEAVFKCLTKEEQIVFSMRDWYKGNTPEGRPFIKNEKFQDNFMVTLSHDGDFLVSFVARMKS